MKAIAISRPGGPEVLEIVEREKPSPGAGEILVRVEAIGLNRPDVQQRRGLYPPPPDASPILGLDVAGTIVAVEGPVAWPRPGDRVCALANGGGYAEYCAVPAGQCLPIPAGLGFAGAASLPEVFFTAWNAVILLGRLEPGERLLVQGGTSGVGLAAIQIARHLRNATIVATASSEEKRALCREAGAIHAIDYRAPDWPAEVRSLLGDCDVIVDSRAGPRTQRQLDLLGSGGRLVLLASHDGPLGEVDTRQIVRRRLTLTGSTLRPRSSAFKAALATALRAEVWPLIERGLIRTHLCATFPLAEAERAQAVLEANRQIGKIVLIVDDTSERGGSPA
jgi:putative PIG3 family NAD(P)H quinone oxidoreductase